MKRKNIISLFLLSAGCMLPLCASAQHVYSLDECIEAALDNNVRMKNAQNNLRMAEHSKQEAFSKYFPTVSAMGSGFLADKSLIRMGLSPEMQMAFMKNGLVGDVSATLPLFTGGQIVNGNKLAKVNVEVNRLQQRQSQNEVTLTVENYFWQVVMLKEKLQTISTLDKQLTQLLQDVETSVQAGVTTRNDLLQVQLRQNEIQSKRIQAENMLSLSRSMLAQYIGHPADSIEVAATLKDTLPQGPEGLYTPPEAALATTNEYNLLQQNVKASSLQHKMAIGKKLADHSYRRRLCLRKPVRKGSYILAGIRYGIRTNLRLVGRLARYPASETTITQCRESACRPESVAGNPYETYMG